jgi:hypothetical protein
VSVTAQSSDTGRRGGVVGGVILIGIGMLALTGWRWPGIMLVIGCGLATERLLKGEVVQAIGALALFLAIPLGVSVLQHIDIPWRLVGPFVLVAVGLAIVVRAIARD